MTKFLKIFQVLIFLSIVFILSFNIVLAAKHFPVLSTGADVLNIDFDERGCVPDPNNDQYCQINWIGTYIAGIYKYGISLAAVLAVVMVMVGGFVWLSSGGSADRIKTAKNYIGSAFAGLLLALFAFVILNTINPRLVNLDPLKIKSIKNQENTQESESKIMCRGDIQKADCNKLPSWTASVLKKNWDIPGEVNASNYNIRSCDEIGICPKPSIVSTNCCVIELK